MLYEENLNVTLMAQPCDRTTVIRMLKEHLEIDCRSCSTVRWQLPEVREAFHCTVREPLKALDQVNAITGLVHRRVLLHKAT